MRAKAGRWLRGLLAITMATWVLGSALPTSATVDPGLDAHWDLDEGSGTTAVDVSGHNHDGTLYNGATYVAGQTGTAVHLNGTDQYIQNTNPLTAIGTADEPYALSAWVKLDAGVTSGNIVHLSSNADGSGWCIPFLALTAGHFNATGWDHTGPEFATDPAAAIAGQWYQVMTTWDATNGLRLFVNGNLVDSTPQTDYAASGSDMYVSFGLGNGNCSGDQGYLKGAVDDLRIYNRTITAQDVQNISTPDDNDGVDSSIESAAPNSGDANADGTPDSQQANVTSLVNPVTGHYVTLAATGCTGGNTNVVAQAATTPDMGYSYPAGLIGFSLGCAAPGATATVSLYYYGTAPNGLVVRKYNAASHTYTTVPGATVSATTVGGQAATRATYTITDGGPLDADGAANGVIVDPAGLGQGILMVPNTGLGGLSRS